MDATCAMCPFAEKERICKVEDKEKGKHPANCPTLGSADLIEKANQMYLDDPDLLEFAQNAARQEASCYEQTSIGRVAIKCRMQETAEFCLRMGYHKIGLAFCGVVRNEAMVFSKILTAYGLEVVSAMCKAGGTPKEHLRLKEEEKNRPGCYETMCNPVAQALLLNEAHTEFNVVMGLCVGHDSMFLKYSDAMCTVVAVKDRVLGHNPMAAVYSDSIKSRLLKGGKK